MTSPVDRRRIERAPWIERVSRRAAARIGQRLPLRGGVLLVGQWRFDAAGWSCAIDIFLYNLV